MAEDLRENTEARKAPAGRKAWVYVGATAAVLLLLSQAVWLWHSWPVRMLLQPGVTPSGGAS